LGEERDHAFFLVGVGEVDEVGDLEVFGEFLAHWGVLFLFLFQEAVESVEARAQFVDFLLVAVGEDFQD
jgi:hypothetical protein